MTAAVLTESDGTIWTQEISHRGGSKRKKEDIDLYIFYSDRILMHRHVHMT